MLIYWLKKITAEFKRTILSVQKKKSYLLQTKSWFDEFG